MLNDKDYHWIYTRVPRGCVDLVIETSQGILLTKREEDPDQGAWHMPGGGIWWRESMEETAKRIAKKELNVEIKLSDVIGFDEYLHAIRDWGDVHEFALIFKAKIVKGNVEGLVKSGKAKFFKTLPKNIVPSHKIALKKFWKNK